MLPKIALCRKKACITACFHDRAARVRKKKISLEKLIAVRKSKNYFTVQKLVKSQRDNQDKLLKGLRVKSSTIIYIKLHFTAKEFYSKCTEMK